MPLVNFSAASDIGVSRSNNEDCYACYPQSGLWIVADGMGGHAAGEVASAMTASIIFESINSGQPLHVAIDKAHKAVIEASNSRPGAQGMGSTVVALLSHYAKNQLHYTLSWVGDSRAYLWQASKGTLTQLTKDHSYVQMLFENGVITKDEISQHHDKNVITQCIGSEDIPTLETPIIEGAWQKNDIIILCSDGLTDSLSHHQIGDILSSNTSVKKITKKLIDAALASGGNDNITVCAVKAPNAWHQWLNQSFGRFIASNNIQPY